MDTCLHCHRRLLSHISARCNWCGAEIEDAAYLAQAEVERATARAEDALHSLQSLAVNPIADNYHRFREVDALFGLRPYTQQDDAPTFAARAEYEAREWERRAAVIHAQQQKASQAGHVEEAPTEEPQTEAHDRFNHLEL